MKHKLRPPKLLFFTILTLFAAQLFGQNTKNSSPVYRYALKGYLDVSHEKKSEAVINYYGRFVTTEQNQTQFSPILGISKLRKKGGFTEISLTHLSLVSDDSQTKSTLLDSLGNVSNTNITIPTRGSKTMQGHLGVRWEWNFPLFFEKMGRFQPFIGLSTDPSVFYQSITPYSTATFPTKIIEVRNTFSVVPRVNIALSSRLFVDIQCPISAFSMAAKYRYESNPILPTYAREKIYASTTWFASTFNFRIGLGYKI
jgi:hypothetical protein